MKELPQDYWSFSLGQIFFGRLANLFRRRRANRVPGRRITFESLEPRVLPSADLIGDAPSAFTFNAPINAALDSYTLRFNSDNGNLELLDGATVAASKALAETTAVVINGEDWQDDSLTVDFAFGGFFSVEGGITYNGGSNGFDGLSVRGGEFTTVTHTVTTTGPGLSGNIVYEDGVNSALTIGYTGLEPVDMTGSTISDLVFNLPGANDLAILEDDGTAGNGISQIRSQNGSPTFDVTTFSNSITSLTVNLGGDSGSFTVAALPDFTKSLTINGEAGTDNVVFSGLTSISGLTVTVGGSISIDGALSSTGNDVNLNGGSLTFNQALNAGVADVRLVSGTTVTQGASGVITADELGILAGSVALTAASNDVAVLAVRTSGAGLVEFRDGDNLTIGNVAAGGNAGFTGAAGIVSNSGDVNLNAGSLAINQALNAATGDARLVAGTTVTQGASGVITADELGIRAGGAVTLAAAINDVNILAAVSTGLIEFIDGDDLTVGFVAAGGNAGFTGTAGVASNSGNLNLRAGTSIVSNQALNAGAGDARLVAGTTVTQAASGAITADELGILAGSVALTAASNDVGTLAVTTTGLVEFRDSDELTIGTVAASGDTGFTGAIGIVSGNSDVNLNADSLTLNQQLNAAAGDARLVAGTTVTQGASGAITADELGIRAGSAVTLAAAINDVGILAVATTGLVEFRDGGNLTIGAVAAGGNAGFTGAAGIVSGNSDVNLNVGSLNLDQGLNAGAGDVRLVADTTVNQSASGVITADELGILAGSVALTAASNDVDILAVRTGGAGLVEFRDGDNLSIDAVAAGGNAGFTGATGIVSNSGDVNLNVGSLAINQALNAAIGDARLVAGTTVTQGASGVITADELGILAGGNVALAAAANDVNILAAATTGLIAFNDADDLTIGFVAAGGNAGFTGAAGINTGGNNLTLVAGSVAIDAPLTTRGGAVQIAADVITSTTAGDIATTAGADTGVPSGAVTITGGTAVNLAGDIVTSGATSSAGGGSAGGLVTISTIDGAITVAGIDTRGGASTAPDGNGGAGGGITINANDAVGGEGGHATTLNGMLLASGGAAGDGGTAGAGGSIFVNVVFSGPSDTRGTGLTTINDDVTTSTSGIIDIRGRGLTQADGAPIFTSGSGMGGFVFLAGGPGEVLLNDSVTGGSGADGILISGGTGVTFHGALTTTGGKVQIFAGAASAVTSSPTGTITTTAQASTVPSGAVTITGGTAVNLAGDIVTSGATSSAGGGSAGGLVTISTIDGAITVAGIDTRGGASTAPDGNGGAGGGITINANDAVGGEGGHATTLNGMLLASGGAAGDGGTAGAGGSIFVNVVFSGPSDTRGTGLTTINDDVTTSTSGIIDIRGRGLTQADGAPIFTSGSGMGGFVFLAGGPGEVLLNDSVTGGSGADGILISGGTGVTFHGALTTTGGKVQIFAGVSGGTIVADGSLTSGTGAIFLTAPGGVFFTADAVVNVDLGGTAAGQFTTITISDAVTLDGTLNTELVNGFTPAAGDGFRFMIFDSRTGLFGTTILPAGFAVDETDPTDLELVVAANSPPFVVNAIADVTVDEDAADTVLDLSATFDDIDDVGLTLSVQSNSNPALVTGSFAGSTLTLDYGADAFGSATITIRATDAGGLFAEETFLVTVNPVNDAPFVANAIADVTVDEDAADTVLDLSATFDDIDDATLTLSVVSNSNPALVTGSFAGSTLTLDYAADAFGSAAITIRATDMGGLFAEDTFQVTVAPVNDAPVANPDSFSVNEDDTLTVSAPGVLGNDTDLDGAVLAATLVSSTANGTLSFNPDGTFTYTPNSNFNGTDSFTYKANDGELESNVATVTIAVNAVNDAPVANPDSFSVNEDGTLTISAPGVLGNDTDVDSPTLTATLVSSTTNGMLSFNSDGSLTYTPNSNFNGTDSFTYKANDGAVDSNVATVTIAVNAVNDAPVNAVPGPQAVNEDTSLLFSVASGNAISVSDVDDAGNGVAGDEVVRVTLAAAHGVISLGSLAGLSFTSGDGSSDAVMTFNGTLSSINTALTGLAYAPGLNFNGSDALTISVDDLGNFGVGAPLSDTDSVSISVLAVNHAPVLAPGLYSFPSAVEDAAPVVPIEVFLASIGPNISDADIGDTQGIAVTGVDNSNGIWQFSLDSGISWDDFGIPTSTSARLLDDSAEMRFVPNTDFNGAVTFQFRAWDRTSGASGGLADTTINGGATAYSILVGTGVLTVMPVNDMPVAHDDSYATNEDMLLEIAAPGLLGNDTDIDSATLTAVLITGPAHGSLALNVDGSFSYIADADFNGSDAFTYRASDGFELSNVATVSIAVNAVNDMPVAHDDSYATNEDMLLEIAAPGLLGNDTDIDSATLTAVLITGPAHGSLALNVDGSFSYIADADFNGSDAFTYRASDGFELSNVATVSIAVNAVNDMPVAHDDSYATNEDMLLEIAAPGLLGNDTDIDSATLTAVLITGPAHGSLALNVDGSFSYIADADFNGSDAFTYRASDGFELSNVATVSIAVNAVNDAPSFVAGADQVVAEDAGPQAVPNWATAISAGPANEGGQTLAGFNLTLTGSTGGLTFTVGPTIDTNGTLSYQAAPNANGSATFFAVLSDNGPGTPPNINQSAGQSFTITVNPVNDAPSFVLAGNPPATNEDAAPQTVPGFATNLSVGPANEFETLVGFNLVQTGVTGGLTFSVAPAIDTNTGTLTYQTAPNANGSATFFAVLTDNGPGTPPNINQSAGQAFTITVNPVNDAPVLAPIGSKTVDEHALLTFIATATDPDVPADTLSFSLDSGAPAGAAIDAATGVFTWTPSEAQGGGTFSITVRITDDGTPALDDFETILVTVNETLAPDLVGAVLWNPDALIVPGNQEHVTVVVSNVGDAAAHDPVMVKLYASVDAILDTSDILLDQGTVSGIINPGASKLDQRNFEFPATVPAGQYFLLAVVDATNNVLESNEANNVTVGPVFNVGGISSLGLEAPASHGEAGGFAGNSTNTPPTGGGIVDWQAGSQDWGTGLNPFAPNKPGKGVSPNFADFLITLGSADRGAQGGGYDSLGGELLGNGRSKPGR